MLMPLTTLRGRRFVALYDQRTAVPVRRCSMYTWSIYMYTSMYTWPSQTYHILGYLVVAKNALYSRIIHVPVALGIQVMRDWLQNAL